MNKKKVVIIGGGFAGVSCAKKLERDFEVVLIDKKDYFEYIPGVLRIIVEPEHIKKIQVLYNKIIKKTRLLKGIVSEVDKKYVLFNKKKVFYDYLIISTGSHYHSKFAGKKVISSVNAETLKEYYNRVKNSKDILIVGGGFTGVELASEIITKYPNKKLTIVNSDRLMSRMHEKASNYARKFLEKRNVKIISGERIEKIKEGFVETDKKRKIPCDLAFLCTGMKSNTKMLEKNFSRIFGENGSLKVNSYLQLMLNPNIFAAGDIININEEKTAQNAEKHAEIISHNIKNLEKGRRLEKYVSKPRILIVSLGKYNGIFIYKKLGFSGIFPGILKNLIEKYIIFKYKFL